MRTVQNIIDSKAKVFNSVSSDTLVFDALSLLNSVDLSYLIVMDGQDYKGIFSERDYSRNVILKGRNSKETKVSEVMTIDLPIVSLHDTLEHCINTMLMNKTRYLLAYDNLEKFAGVITIHDLLRQIIANREDAFDHATAQRLIDQDEGGRVY
jgi:CBS domain-containing protein